MQKANSTYAERQKTAKARYIAEKTDYIAAHLPTGYKEKVNKLAEKHNTSKAQILKKAIDTLYNKDFCDE